MQLVSIDVDWAKSISETKRAVQNQSGIDVQSMQLVFQSVHLLDDRCLLDYNVMAGSTLHFLPAERLTLKAPSAQASAYVATYASVQEARAHDANDPDGVASPPPKKRAARACFHSSH